MATDGTLRTFKKRGVYGHPSWAKMEKFRRHRWPEPSSCRLCSLLTSKNTHRCCWNTNSTFRLFAITDTNTDPTLADFAIPAANDDATKSHRVDCWNHGKAIEEGLSERKWQGNGKRKKKKLKWQALKRLYQFLRKMTDWRYSTGRS